MSFDEFWAAYPNKKAKQFAKRAYVKALNVATHEEIMAGVQRYVEAEPWDGNWHHCKHPATWLNAGCWDDVHEAPRRELEWYERMANTERIRKEMKLDS